MSDESVSNKPPEAESTNPSPLADSAGSELDREIALHLPPADGELDAAIHSPTQATSPSLRRIARARARSRQAWLAAALFAGIACVGLFWVTLFPGSTAGSGPEPRVSIESSRTARAVPAAVPAARPASAPGSIAEPIEEAPPAEVASSVASTSRDTELVAAGAQAAHGSVPTSSATRAVAAQPRARVEKPTTPDEERAPRAREDVTPEVAPAAAPPPSSKFVFQPQ